MARSGSAGNGRRLAEAGASPAYASRRPLAAIGWGRWFENADDDAIVGTRRAVALAVLLWALWALWGALPLENKSDAEVQAWLFSPALAGALGAFVLGWPWAVVWSVLFPVGFALVIVVLAVVGSGSVALGDRLAILLFGIAVAVAPSIVAAAIRQFARWVWLRLWGPFR